MKGFDFIRRDPMQNYVNVTERSNEIMDALNKLSKKEVGESVSIGSNDANLIQNMNAFLLDRNNSVMDVDYSLKTPISNYSPAAYMTSFKSY
ncbi:hypothetical protein [Providencia sp. Je.9.19]|uniref:hypothetical protein n=1 Tax=Providencia sp. Je.9.19 TaxID=3142844 RepID=UPI003DA96AE7